jgi:signal transduction histidine kinase
MSARGRQDLRLCGGARVLGLLALVVPVLWSQQRTTLLGLVAVGVVAGLAHVAQARRVARPTVLVTAEAAAVGVVCGLELPTSVAILGALAVPAFTAGLRLGWRGVGLVVGTETVLLLAVPVVAYGALTTEEVFSALTWGITSLGIGLIAGSLHDSLQDFSDPLAPYRYAQRLFRELIDLSGGLSSGLDPAALGSTILRTVSDDLPATALRLYVPRGDALTPLLSDPVVDPSGEDGAGPDALDDLAVEAWSRHRRVVADHAFAFPLVTEGSACAVVAGRLSARVDPDRIGLEERLARLGRRLAANTVHLDTALLFAAFRDSATADERRRLAREMHDGVAQDIASLGYLVDALATRATDPEQAARIAVLRERISAVVGEVRRSVLTLRTETATSESLGSAIGAVARNLTEVSGVPIHVSLDERATRLRPEVESELFRISQEAMTNAVRHARPSRIDVHCLVHAPEAQITVTDDGRGLQPARSDSHGLQIMRERALLINASLSITPGPGGGGTEVCVRTPAPDDESAGSAADRDGIVSA